MTKQRRTKRGAGFPCANVVLEVLESRRLLAAELLKDVDAAAGPTESR